jgi:hypothetical protein
MAKSTPSYWQKTFGPAWRGNKADKPQIRVSGQLDYYTAGTTGEIVEKIRAAADGLEEARWAYEFEYGVYGDSDKTILTVMGWRDATEEEISARETELSVYKQKQDSHLDAAEALLRKNRPELFKE